MLFSAHIIRGLLKKFNSLILFLTPSLLQSWPVTLDTDDTRKGRLPGVYRAPTAEMLSYLDFSVSTTGMLAGIKMSHASTTALCRLILWTFDNINRDLVPNAHLTYNPNA